MPVLTNPRSDRVRSVKALTRRSSRDRAGLFLVEGPQSVREAVRHAPGAVVDLYVESVAAQHNPAVREIVGTAEQAGLPVHLTSAEVLTAMTDTPAPQGIVAACRPVDVSLSDVLATEPGVVVVLAHVRDPGNAGTVIRGADASGAGAVLISDSSVDVYNPKVVRSTAGSLFHLPIVRGLPMTKMVEELRRSGMTVLAADASGTQLVGETDLSRRHAWVLGNEAWGLPQDVREACDEVVRVPIYGLAESLNLAMAATVCLYASAAAQRGHT